MNVGARRVIGTGRVLRGQIVLDEPLQTLEGGRVRVVVEPDPDADVSADDVAAAWVAWAARGTDGPIDDDDSEVPDTSG